MPPQDRVRAPVAPGEDVMSLRQEIVEIGNLVRSGNAGTFAQLRALQSKYGTELLRALPKLASETPVERRGR